MGSSRELDAQCEAGTYARLTDRSGDPECLDCPAGSSCGGAAAPPSECSPGSFAATAGLSECASCAGGTYQGESNATGCLPCVEGSYCAEGASAPLPCVAGSYSTATNLTATLASAAITARASGRAIGGQPTVATAPIAAAANGRL